LFNIFFSNSLSSFFDGFFNHTLPITTTKTVANNQGLIGWAWGGAGLGSVFFLAFNWACKLTISSLNLLNSFCLRVSSFLSDNQ
jgi:hypothetical protein